MQCSYFSTQESGPDEDHQIQSLKLQKVLDDEDQYAGWNRGIFGVEKSSTLIDEFIDSIPLLVRQDGTFGLIWNKSLQPSDGRYEPGEHFCCTREPERKSINGSVSFYRDGETGEKFAIKTLQDSDHFHSWEIKIGIICNSPNLCAVYGVIIRDHRIHILLEHAGSELTKERSWIAESSDRILAFAKQSFQALQDLHRYGYVHCDIKPDNIMVVRNTGEEFTVKVIDFGSCQPIGGVLPPEAHTTRFYWSPEIWQALNNGEHVICQPAMDIYALALTLFFVQTSGHLMNMLQERDILPLMTQRSEDLLLIALPETIPSGLRAVMRPCLAGRVENRLSAQQAANQLDGDAMIQRALSNPRGENYKDLFQQLLRNQAEKSQPKNPVSVAAESSKQTAPVTGTKPETLATTTTTPHRDHSSIHYFVASSGKSVEKREMGLQMKPVGTKASVEKKLAPVARVKRNGSFCNSKWAKGLPKPKKIVMKGGAPLPKHKKQNHASNNQICQEGGDQEVHYISSDETMLQAPHKDQKGPPGEHNIALESCHQSPVVKNLPMEFARQQTEDRADVFPMYGSFGKTTHSNNNSNIEIAASENSRPSFRDSSTAVTQPTATIQDAPTAMTPQTPSDPDVRAFSCSALLATLASQARSSSEGFLPIQPKSAGPHTKIEGQIFVQDDSLHEPNPMYKVPRKRPPDAIPQPCKDSVFKNRNHSDQLNIKTSECKVQKKPEKAQQGCPNIPSSVSGKKTSAISHQLDGAKTDVCRSQILEGHRLVLTRPGSAAVWREKEDEMEFVFQALEIPQFTGQAEDILDNLCNMLDKDECRPVITEHASLRLTGHNCVTHNNSEEEPMDTGGEVRGNINANLIRSRLPPHGESSRKRILGSGEGKIPAKMAARQSHSDVHMTEHLLPNFDKILPENI